MIALIEEELKIRDKELKELSMDTLPNVSSRADSLATEKQILHKLLKEQKLKQQSNLFKLENGLLLSAIGMFGVLAAFVFYLLSRVNAFQGTWEQMGSDMAVLILLFIMTSISTALYLGHYKHNLSN